jgi:hypothetical protein
LGIFWDSILIAVFFARTAVFTAKGVSRVAPRFDPKDLRAIFEHRVLRMLLSRGKITRDLIVLIRSWRHSGFQVYGGPRILPDEEEATENLARYIIRASFSQERMTYLHKEVQGDL